jgi:magnesium transporter
MITAYRWDAAAKAGHWAEGRDALGLPPAGEDVAWIDLQGSTPEEAQLVLQQWFPVHLLTFEDVTRMQRLPGCLPHLPKVEEFPDYLFVIVNPLTAEAGKALVGEDPGCLTTQLSAVMTQGLLITHHSAPLASIDALRCYLQRHDAQAGRGPDYLLHLILDDMVDQYAPLLDALEDELDRLEEEVFGRPASGILAKLLRLKRVVVVVRKTLIHEREILARLQRGDFALITDRERAYYRNVYDHLLRFTELVEGARDMVSDLMQAHLAAMSNRLNEIMKALTMVSTVVLPMTLIAGIYGMNFEQMPGLHTPWGYPLSLALMGLTGVASFAFFKWKKWI